MSYSLSWLLADSLLGGKVEMKQINKRPDRTLNLCKLNDDKKKKKLKNEIVCVTKWRFKWCPIPKSAFIIIEFNQVHIMYVLVHEKYLVNTQHTVTRIYIFSLLIAM